MGVELWVSGPGVEVVVGDGGDPRDADLRHGTIAEIPALVAATSRSKKSMTSATAA